MSSTVRAEREHEEKEGDEKHVGNLLLPDASHSLKGKLRIRGTYMEVVLEIECAWKSSSSSSPSLLSSERNEHGDEMSSKYGTLCYKCVVDSASFVQATSHSSSSSGGDDNTNSKKSQQRIHEKMVQRLQQDSYISKYLLLTVSPRHPERIGDKNDADNEDNRVLATARICISKSDDRTNADSSNDNNKLPPSTIDVEGMIEQIYANAVASEKRSDGNRRGPRGDTEQRLHVGHLEERVDVSEPVAEAIRRAIWSSSESSLDIVEFVLSMPSLPTMEHHTKTNTFATTPLANRAKLRLLEDAMLDACEREGEDGLLEDLSINKDDGSSERRLAGEANKEVRAGSSSNPHEGRNTDGSVNGPRRKRGKRRK
jgi:hypothetical protein